jgi:hypothetical protein
MISPTPTSKENYNTDNYIALVILILLVASGAYIAYLNWATISSLATLSISWTSNIFTTKAPNFVLTETFKKLLYVSLLCTGCYTFGYIANSQHCDEAEKEKTLHILSNICTPIVRQTLACLALMFLMPFPDLISFAFAALVFMDICITGEQDKQFSIQNSIMVIYYTILIFSIFEAHMGLVAISSILPVASSISSFFNSAILYFTTAFFTVSYNIGAVTPIVFTPKIIEEYGLPGSKTEKHYNDNGYNKGKSPAKHPQ